MLLSTVKRRGLYPPLLVKPAQMQLPGLRQPVLSQVQQPSQRRVWPVPLLLPEAQLVLRAPPAQFSRAVVQPRLWRQLARKRQPARLVASLQLQLQAALLLRQDASSKFLSVNLRRGAQ